MSESEKCMCLKSESDGAVFLKELGKELKKFRKNNNMVMVEHLLLLSSRLALFLVMDVVRERQISDWRVEFSDKIINKGIYHHFQEGQSENWVLISNILSQFGR